MIWCLNTNSKHTSHAHEILATNVNRYQEASTDDMDEEYLEEEQI